MEELQKIIFGQQYNSSYIFFCIHLATDLVLLSLADHSILTYGTYGMWGALLAKGGETIMSKDFLRTDIGNQIATANLTNWKVIG